MQDWFSAPVHCHACGAHWDPDRGPVRSTCIATVNVHRGYGAGDSIDIPKTADGIRASGYMPGGAPWTSPDEVSLLHYWSCPNAHCDGQNALRVRIAGGVVVSFESARLDQRSVCRTNFISDDLPNRVLGALLIQKYPDYDEVLVGGYLFGELVELLCSGYECRE